MLKKEIMIVNKLGLHARAAAKFVSLASSFSSDIGLSRDNKRVNGKSIMGVMMLAASQGTVLEVSADGNDEALAIERIQELIQNRFGEDS